MNTQGCFSLGLTGLIFLQSKGLSRVSSKPQFKSIKSSALRFLYGLSDMYMTTRKTIALTIWTFVCKVMSVLFNALSRFVIAFFPRSKRLLISGLQSPSAVVLELKKIKPVTVSIMSPSLFHDVTGPDTMIIVF